MKDLRVPTVLAVGMWLASALAVASYTYLALKETSSGAGEVTGGEKNPLVASKKIMDAEDLVELLPEITPQQAQHPGKTLERGRFKPSK